MFHKIKKVVSDEISLIRDSFKKGKVAFLLAFSYVSTASMSVLTYAAPQDLSQENLENGLNNVVNWISWIFMWVGIVMLVAAFISIFSAVRNEDGERQQKGITNALVALLIAANKPILNAIFSAMALDITIGSPWG